MVLFEPRRFAPANVSGRAGPSLAPTGPVNPKTPPSTSVWKKAAEGSQWPGSVSLIHILQIGVGDRIYFISSAVDPVEALATGVNAHLVGADELMPLGSCENRLNDVAVNVGQAVVTSIEAIGQALVINAY